MRALGAAVIILSVLGGMLGNSCALAAEPVVIKIEGLTEPLERNVRATLSLSQENALTAPARIRLAAERAETEIRRALEPFGHYRVKVSGDVVRRDHNWYAHYRVDPGPPIKLAEVDVSLSGEAIHEPELREAVAQFPLRPGDVLDHSLYESGKQAIQGLAAELGFFDAQLVKHEIQIDLKAYRARIELRLDGGRRYTFGAVRFSDTPLDSDLLRRFVRFAPGDPYRASLLFALQKNLLNSGFFSQVDIVPQPEKALDQAAPIRVDLGMAPQNRFDLGGGFGTDTGPRLSLGYRNRFLNRYGHSFQANARLSFIWNELNAMYTIPLADPVVDQLAFTAKTGIEDTLAGISRMIVGGIRHATTRWKLREVLGLDFHQENFRVAGATQSAFLLIPNVNYTYRQADEDINPTEGLRFDANLAGAWEGLASAVSFARLRLIGRGLHSFNPDNQVVLRGQLAELITNDFDRLPISQRLYAGGPQTVRGYRYNEIAPRNAQGSLIGGRHLAVGSLEYRRTVYGDWAMAMFSDLAHVYNSGPEPVYVGVGAGVRWRSPVGPIRLDVGVPLQQALDPFQINLILGPDL